VKILKNFWAQQSEFSAPMPAKRIMEINECPARIVESRRLSKTLVTSKTQLSNEALLFLCLSLGTLFRNIALSMCIYKYFWQIYLGAIGGHIAFVLVFVTHDTAGQSAYIICAIFQTYLKDTGDLSLCPDSSTVEQSN